MAIERTLSILKPDVTRRNLCGSILVELESAGLIIIAQKRLTLTITQARAFYEAHHQRPFFEELCQFMVSGPIVAQVLEGENAIAHYRDMMGATDPSQALPGTIRACFARSITENSIHGSDGPDTASGEIAFFFSQIELLG